MTDPTDPTPFERGWAKMLAVDGKAGELTYEFLQEMDPEMARYFIEFAFGEVYSRPGLDLKTKELTTVAILTVQGNVPTQLKVHIHAALNLGATRQEVIEVIVHTILYAGFPVALNALVVAKEVFAKRDARQPDDAE